MDRRRLLLGMLGGVTGGLAGCATTTGSKNSPDAPESSPITGEDGSPSDICQSDPKPGRIPAIVDPAFASDYGDVSAALYDSTAVIGVERNGAARAYPLRATNEMVNDAFDVPVLVTYCPLCASGLTAIRRVDGEETIFGNTSFTWTPPGGPGQDAIEEDRVFGVGRGSNPGEATPRNDPNLVMFDQKTGSYWSQLLAKAICGPKTGEELELIPSTATDWGSWQEQHPDSRVLFPPPHSTTMEP